MCYRLWIVTSAALTLSGASAMAGELPTYEVMGFPITPHQVVALGSAHIEERAPTPVLTVAGMPASPLQLAVLARRSNIVASGR